MRSNPFKSLALMFLMIASASSAFGQVTNVIDWNTVWRYSQGGVLPAANWMTNTYSDTAWPSGQGVLGFPAGESLTNSGASLNTILSSTDTNGVYIFTYYFRTTFVLSTTNGVTLMASNLLDDGAVIYLNGREVARPGMAAGTVAYTTQATRGGDILDSGHGIDAFAIPISFARAGTNLVAVEVHQNGTASSDMIMGMRIVADIPNPPTITQQPQDITVDAGQTAQFTVVATGSTPLTYRWYTNGVLIPALNSPTYTTPATTLAMDGLMVYVTVSNRFGIRTSTTNVLTVVQDLNGPTMISAITTATNSFEIRFNETITQASSQNPSNYIVRILGTTNSLVVTQAQWGINISRLRIAGTFDPNSNYVVCIYGIADQRGNITSGDCIGITGQPLTNDVTSLGSEWHFTDRVIDNTLANTNWTAFNFDDSEEAGWGISFGLFWAYINAPSTCSTPNTEILRGARTHYYRKKFTVAALPVTNITLVIRHVVDDGAVFYINTNEVGRFNMPAGPVSYSTVASGSAGVAACNTLLVNVHSSLLTVGGNNIMAVEVHQAEADPAQADGDAGFDAELDISYRRTPTIPALTIRKTQTASVTNVFVEYVPTPGVTWQLQHSTAPSGAVWQNISTSPVQGTNRYLTPLPAQGPRRFYRLKNP